MSRNFYLKLQYENMIHTLLSTYNTDTEFKVSAMNSQGNELVPKLLSE